MSPAVVKKVDFYRDQDPETVAKTYLEFIEEYNKVAESLRGIKELMCDGATVVFVVCQLGRSPEMVNRIQAMLPGINLRTWSDNCGYILGVPVTTNKATR